MKIYKRIAKIQKMTDGKRECAKKMKCTKSESRE